MSKYEKYPRRTLVFLASPWIAVCLVYAIVGHWLVTALYEGRIPGPLSGVITQQAHVPLNIYLIKADAWFVVISLIYLCISGVILGVIIGRRHRLIRRLTNGILYLLFLLVVVEVSGRIYFRIRGIDIDIYRNYTFRAMGSLLIEDELLGSKLKPNARENAVCSDFEVSYETNDLGLRDDPLRESDEFRILFLGDSQTFGWGVPFGERFTERIEQNIPGVQVINAGVPGYGIHQMKLWLEHHGFDLKPDLVVLTFIYQDLLRAAWADIIDSDVLPHVMRPTRQVTTNPHSSTQGHQIDQSPKCEFDHRTAISEAITSILRQSELYSFLSVKIRFLLNRDIHDGERFIDRERRAGNVKINNDLETIVQSSSQKVLAELYELASIHEIPLLVVKIDAAPILWLKEVSADLGMNYVDLAPYLQGRRNFTFEIDPHYNAKGHEQIGLHLTEEILARYGNKIEKFK